MTTVISGSSPSITFSDATTQSTTAPSTSTFGFKNRIINGGMVIDQRNAGASVTPADGAYVLDRYKYEASQSSKFTVQQLSASPPTGFSNYLGMTVASSVSISSTDYFLMEQFIEGFNFSDMAWGTSNAKTVTLSFQVYSSLTGTFGVSLRNSAVNRNYQASYTIPVANTWTSISITIAGDTTGTWVGATNGVGLRVSWGLGVGSTFSTSGGAWGAGNIFGLTGATSVVGTSGATFYITGVQLEVGTQATSFDFRDYGRELILCQRYYETNFPLGVAPVVNYSQSPTDIGSISYNGNTTRTPPIFFKVTKRSSPTVTLYSPAGYASTSSNTFNIYISGTWYNYSGTPAVNAAYFYLDGTTAGGSGSTGSAYLTAGNWSASSEL
jgi:hypothetical protein